jgi:RNA methyltransferase, TrmH family
VRRLWLHCSRVYNPFVFTSNHVDYRCSTSLYRWWFAPPREECVYERLNYVKLRRASRGRLRSPTAFLIPAFLIHFPVQDQGRGLAIAAGYFVLLSIFRVGKDRAVTITSFQNPQIKQVVKLHKRRERDRLGKMVIEGYRAILAALDNGYPLCELYCCPSLFFGKNEPQLIERAAQTGAKIIEVSTGPFTKMAQRERPEGLLALAPQIRHPLYDHPPGKQGLYLIAEAIEKPANLGALLRAADGAGADALILCDRCTDLFNPDVVRGSVGAFFSLPTLEAASAEALAWCRRHRILTLAATPHSDCLYTAVDLRQPVAIVVGAEQYGLSEQWLRGADQQVALPMFGQINSLNVAVAAALLLYEVVRQRSPLGLTAAGVGSALTV